PNRDTRRTRISKNHLVGLTCCWSGGGRNSASSPGELAAEVSAGPQSLSPGQSEAEVRTWRRMGGRLCLSICSGENPEQRVDRESGPETRAIPGPAQEIATQLRNQAWGWPWCAAGNASDG